MKRIVNAAYRIYSERLPQVFHGTKLVMLSDLHDNVYGISLEELYRMIDKEQPDFVLVAGDLLTRKDSDGSENVVALLGRLSEKYPVCFTNGNHETKVNLYREQFGGRYDEFMADLKKAGVTILNNGRIDYKKQGDTLHIYGLEIDKRFYNITKRPKMEKDYIRGKLGEPLPGYRILIAHNPMFFEQYAAWGADLTFSGHVHGGIVRMPWGKGVLNPDYRLFPKYDGGEYTIGASKLILGRGLGTHTVNVRINNPPELVTAVLCRASKQQPKSGGISEKSSRSKFKVK